MFPRVKSILAHFYCIHKLHYLYEWRTLFRIWWIYWSNMKLVLLLFICCFFPLLSIWKVKFILADFFVWEPPLSWNGEEQYSESGGFMGAIWKSNTHKHQRSFPEVEAEFWFGGADSEVYTGCPLYRVQCVYCIYVQKNLSFGSTAHPFFYKKKSKLFWHLTFFDSFYC